LQTFTIPDADSDCVQYSTDSKSLETYPSESHWFLK
jgi:hypothetical protein